jgi:predicted transcriptional regulator
MSEGATKLNYAIKTLRRHWDEISPHWQDAVRADFEARHLDPLITQVTATVRGMNQLDEVLQKMRRDCS